MKNIHLLPTYKPSRLTKALHYSNVLRLVHQNYKCDVKDEQYQHIYITSDEKPTQGDWCIDKHNVVFKQETDKIFPEFTGSKKIILTTDQDLIKDGVQKIDDEFLEWFVNNSSCEYVEVKKGFPDGTNYGYNFLDYKIIIPQKEPKQDRTCNNNCSDVCGECQILESKPLLSVEWLLRYIGDLNNKGYTFIPSSNKEIVEHIKQMEKDNMIAFLKFVFQQDGFDYEQAYNNFLKQI